MLTLKSVYNFVKALESPALNIGTTLANLSSEGNTPDFNENFIMKVNGSIKLSSGLYINALFKNIGREFIVSSTREEWITFATSTHETSNTAMLPVIL